MDVLYKNRSRSEGGGKLQNRRATTAEEYASKVEKELRLKEMEEKDLEGLWKDYKDGLVKNANKVCVAKPKFQMSGRVQHGAV